VPTQVARTAKSATESERRVLVLSGSKGGCGKSTICRNVLVAAKQAGLSAIGIDMDRQATLTKWAERRQHARVAVPECVSVDVFPARVTGWEDALSDATSADLIVVDTAPSVEEHMASVLALCRAATLTVVPTGSTDDDLDSVIPWMKTLLAGGIRAEFVLNKVNARTRSFTAATARLNKAGRICPVNIPQLEDIHMPNGRGFVPLDFDRAKAIEPLDAVWTYLRREVGL